MSYFPISENFKPTLRKEALAKRKSLATEALSAQIQKHLSVWPVFRESETVLFHYPFRGEMDVLPLATAFSEKQWYLPRVESDERMHFYRYTKGSPLEVGRYGIPEPAPSCEEWERQASRKLLILLPGLLFDRQGYRLGYGKGYYDRLLAQLQTEGCFYTAVGLVPTALICEALPHEAWDVPMHALATENGVLPF